MKYPGIRRQDWVLLEAIAAEKRGNIKKAQKLYETVIEFNSENDPPYRANAEAIAYAGRIAQVIGMNKKLVIALKKKYDERKAIEENAAQLSYDLRLVN